MSKSYFEQATLCYIVYTQTLLDTMIDRRLSSINQVYLQLKEKLQIFTEDQQDFKLKANQDLLVERVNCQVKALAHLSRALGGSTDIDIEVILKSPYAAVEYAQRVLKARWREAEPLILKSHCYLILDYAKDVVKGRWIEAEHIILSDPNVSEMYSVFALECRWLIAENTILTDKDAVLNYITGFNLIWVDGFFVLIKNPEYCLIASRNLSVPHNLLEYGMGQCAFTSIAYAVHLEAPFPEGEEAIATLSVTSLEYATTVLKKRFFLFEHNIQDRCLTDVGLIDLFSYCEKIIGGTWLAAEYYLYPDPTYKKRYQELWGLSE